MNIIISSILLPALSAALLTVASPGFDLWFIAYIALIPMLIGVSKSPKPYIAGWFFGFIYYAVNMRWVVTAVSDFGNSPKFVGILVCIAFTFALGAFWGLFGWIAGKKKNANLLLAGVIVALEVVRANILSGFPWLNLSHTQYTFLPAIQIAEIAGEFAISLIVAYVNLSLASVILRRNFQSVIFAAVMLGASFSYGLLSADREYSGETLKTRIIQPAYSQADKWNPEKQFDIKILVNQLIRESEPEKYDLLMLPETVYPSFMTPDFSGYALMEVYGYKVPLITGGIRYKEKEDKRTYHNSVFMFNNDTRLVYDKRHLVPFGEYFPLAGIFKPIDYYFFKNAEDFTPGKDPIIFAGDNYRAAPLICYESAYSELVREQVIKGADILTVVTNDSWFGKTQGPYQHLAADVMRAVEFRKGVVRAAQNGISACIEPSGKITDSIGLDKKGYLDCDAKTYRGLTLFATGGYGWLALFLFASWFISRRRS
jgi:apolipoprotein N-acyltransferase